MKYFQLNLVRHVCTISCHVSYLSAPETHYCGLSCLLDLFMICLGWYMGYPSFYTMFSVSLLVHCQNLWIISEPLLTISGGGNVPTAGYLHPDPLKTVLAKSGHIDPLLTPVGVSMTSLISLPDVEVRSKVSYTLSASSFGRIDDISQDWYPNDT